VGVNPAFELPNSCHKGLTDLLTYFIAVVTAAVAWNQLSLLFVFVIEKMAANLLSHSRPWPWVCGLGLDTFGLVNIPGVYM